MANIKSAKKRINVIDRRTAENRLVKTALATEIKKYRKELEENKLEEAYNHLSVLVAQINEACSHGVIHKNTAARKVSRLYLAYNKKSVGTGAPEVKPEEVKSEQVVEEKEEVKVEEKKPAKKAAKTEKVEKAKATKTEKKTVEKKPTTKKTVEKKAEVKKETKTAAKKPAAKKETKPAAKKTTTKKTK